MKQGRASDLFSLMSKVWLSVFSVSFVFMWYLCCRFGLGVRPGDVAAVSVVVASMSLWRIAVLVHRYARAVNAVGESLDRSREPIRVNWSK